MQYGVRSLILKTLPVASSMALCCLVPLKSATAQITPDSTLGTERSVVTPYNGLPVDLIGGGAQRGANLFHSFSQFNVNAGRGAYFINPNGVQNIFSRVTGSNPSTILGTLGVLGNANLFLINPNGITFGSNARLAVSGSFLATTADAFVFNNGLKFSATNPQAPPLLTVNIPIGLRFRDNPGSIVNQSAGLLVQPGQGLALVGGNVTLNGGYLIAPGGRVELGGLSQAGTLGINSDGSLSFPQGVQRADVSLTRGAAVDVIAGGGGSIAINAGNVNILTGSVLLAGIGKGLGSVGAIAGDITLNVTGETKITGSYIFNDVLSGGVGKGGGINITTGSLSLTNGAFLGTSTEGQGDAGSVNINARDTVTFDGVASNGLSSDVFSEVNLGGVGKGGDITITTESGSLWVTGGAQLDTSNFGKGDAGSINITTGSLFVMGGAGIGALTGGQGNAGSININAHDTVTLDGAGIIPKILTGGVGGITRHSNVATLVEGGGGKGGNINIFARSLFLSNGAYLTTSRLEGQGDSGNILVNATDSISINSSAKIDTFNAGQGNGGNVTLLAGKQVSLSGSSFISTSSAGSIFGNVGNGRSGDIDIQTRSLFLSDGANLMTSILGGQGDSGKILVNATDSISVNSGASIDTINGGQGNGGNVTLLAGKQVSLSNGDVDTVALGNGRSGNIDIQTRSLSATNGSLLNSRTFGGDAGNITVFASDAVSFDGVNSRATSLSVLGAAGNAGDIKITAKSLSLTNGAFLNSTSKGSGTAGSIEVSTAKDILLDNGSSIASNTSGGQGNINLRSRDLFLRHNSSITTNATGTATGGNITINTGNLVAVPKENSDISANAQDSFGGRVTVTAAGIFGTQFRPHLTPLSDITATSNLGPQFNGTVQLNILSPDPTRGLSELPQNVVDPASQIANNPCTKGKSSEFTIAGRGGLPPNPNEALNSDAVSVGLVDAPASHQGSRRDTAPVPTPKTTIQKPIVLAQGWVYNDKGQVVLTAYNPAVTQQQRPWRNPGACHAL